MGVMTSSGAVVRLAGANVSTSIPEDAFNEWISGAEALINVTTRNKYNDSFPTLNGNVNGIMADTAASIAAMDAVKYDMSGYTSRYEAETLLDVLRDKVLRALALLRDKKTQDFVDGA